MGQKYKNDDIRTAISNNTKLDGYSDKVPSEIDDKVQLICDVTPQNNRFTNFVYSANVGAGTDTINLSTSKDFYLTGFYINSSLGVSLSSQDDYITITLSGVSQVLANNSINVGGAGVTNTVVSNIGQTLLNPLKLDRGSNIVLTKASDSVAWGIYGYYVDPNVYDTGADIKPLTLS